MDRDIENEIDYSYYTVAYDTYGYYATYFPDGSGGFLNPMQRQHLDYHYTKHSQELRVSSPSEDRFRITLGAFYQRQSNDIDAQYIVDGISGADLASIVWFQPIVDDTVYLKRLARRDKDYALFGQADFDLTDDLTLTAGIRGFKVDNTLLGFSGYSYNIDASCLPSSDPDIPCYNVFEDGATTATPKAIKETGETHKVSLSYDIDADRMIYATYSTGYRPGGINRKISYGEFKSDTLSNFEFGWKTSWANGKLRWNGAVFYQKWDDMQFALARPGDAGVTSIANVGGAESKGIETDVLFNTGGLSLSVSGTYLDAKITTDFCDVAGCTPEGTRLPIQPKFKVNASARYTFPIGAGDAFVQAGLLHQSGTRTFLMDQDVANVGFTDGFTTADFSAGIDFDRFGIEAFIQNAFDERGELSRNTACATGYCGIYYRIYPVQPQLFGIKLSYRFGE
jgi:outer membrane receptor protein involved in Fe transport